VAATGIDGISEILGDKADYLLGHTCTTIDKGRLHLPGTDFVDRVVRESDRPHLHL
jgi:class I fructose-bisphosphate aldolase